MNNKKIINEMSLLIKQLKFLVKSFAILFIYAE